MARLEGRNGEGEMTKDEGHLLEGRRELEEELVEQMSRAVKVVRISRAVYRARPTWHVPGTVC